MEIIVQGKGKEFFTPNEVTLNFTFTIKGQTYEEVLREGVKNVQYFVDELLLQNNFEKENLKTRNFVIKEETRYDNLTHQNIFEGFSFNQYATLKFDYDKEKLATMMVSISKLDNAPMCQVDFGVKDEKDCRKKILAKAYKDAEEQALAIAEAAGKCLKQCAKVDFKPFTSDYHSRARYGSDIMYAEKAVAGVAQTIANTFTPEDIVLTETLYCLWNAE